MLVCPESPANRSAGEDLAPAMGEGGSAVPAPPPRDPRKLVSVVIGCYNEEENVKDLYEEIRGVFESLGRFRWELIFADNASRDGTLRILKEIAAIDCRVKIIANWRNFGHIRSPYHALLQARGDAVISMAADFQDPPALIPAFLEKWEAGLPVVLGVKTSSEEPARLFLVRRVYYGLIRRLSDVEMIPQATGFGLYDQSFIKLLRKLDDPYPYMRGLISEFGLAYAVVPFKQPLRRHGVTKNNFFTNYDLAMIGITSHSKAPLRFATIAGFGLSAMSLLVAVGYLAYKLVFWNRFAVGIAPLVIGLFLSFSVQLFFMGLLGEYIAVIHTRVMKRPLVVERERVNFKADERPAG
jgi:glycosyltransferase involved in cell wall biosynthesis